MTDDEFNAVWAAAFPKLFRYCQFRCASIPDAEEVTAEAFARLLGQGPMPAAKVVPWLYRVASNLSVDRIRAQRRLVSLEDVGDVPGAAQQWSDPLVWGAVKQLASDRQLVVYLRVVEDRSFAEVASVLGRSEAAAKMLYRRALDQLEALLEVRDSD